MNTIDFQIKLLGKHDYDAKDNIWGLFVRDGKLEDD